MWNYNIDRKEGAIRKQKIYLLYVDEKFQTISTPRLIPFQNWSSYSRIKRPAISQWRKNMREVLDNMKYGWNRREK